MSRVRVYCVSKPWKIFGLLSMPLLIALFTWFMMMPVVNWDKWESHSYEVYFLLILMEIIVGSLNVYFIFGLIAIFKSRLEIHPDKIVDVGVFRTTELAINDIKGYRIQRLQYNSRLYVIPNNPEMKKIKIDLVLERKKELMQWVNDNLIDLTRVDTDNEMDEIRTNAEVGSSENDRLDRLKRAKFWARVLNCIGVAVVIWGIFYPRPYSLIIWILVLLPIGSLVFISFFNGLIKIDNPRTSVYPSVGVAILMPFFGLALRAINDYSILSYTPFWTPFVVVSLVLAIALIIKEPFTHTTKLQCGIRILFCFIYGYGAVVSLNGLLDDAVPRKYQVTVLDKKRGGEKNRTCYLILERDAGPELPGRIKVQTSVYIKYEPGDEAIVIIHPGKFNIPWFYVI